MTERTTIPADRITNFDASKRIGSLNRFDGIKRQLNFLVNKVRNR